jgi:hypothetical protein
MVDLVIMIVALSLVVSGIPLPRRKEPDEYVDIRVARRLINHWTMEQ